MEILLIRDAERVCDKCHTIRRAAAQRTRSPVAIRPFTAEELGVDMGCAPAPVVGRVGVDLSGMVADYAAPITTKQTSSNLSFIHVDHRNAAAASAGNNTNNFNTSSGDGGGGAFASTRQSRAVGRSGAHKRASNVHTCIKSSFEQQLWHTGAGGGKGGGGGSKEGSSGGQKKKGSKDAASPVGVGVGGGGGSPFVLGDSVDGSAQVSSPKGSKGGLLGSINRRVGAVLGTGDGSSATGANANISSSSSTTTAGGGGTERSPADADVSTVNFSQAAAIEEAQGEAEVLLARFLLPFQDAYAEE